MSFQESSETLQSRLHLGGIEPRLLIVLLLVVAMLLAVGANALVSLVSNHGFAVQKVEASADGASDAGSSKASDIQGENQLLETVSEPKYIFVHVSGCVGSPGVYGLVEGSRVCDAIKAAGGFSEDAARGYLNEARLLSDGEQLAVPSIEDLAQGGVEGQELWKGESGSIASPSDGGGLVNINTATMEELVGLDGIGEATAKKIIADREKNGEFASIEDIKRVSGIGDRKFEAIADDICV